jgi:antitoxin ParD1/3/4
LPVKKIKIFRQNQDLDRKGFLVADGRRIMASGDFASIEEAGRQLIEERIAERELLESSDLAWAKPFVEEGLAALERGEFITLEEHKARNAVRLSAIKG